jgi:hypothetical protein
MNHMHLLSLFLTIVFSANMSAFASGPGKELFPEVTPRVDRVSLRCPHALLDSFFWGTALLEGAQCFYERNDSVWVSIPSLVFLKADSAGCGCVKNAMHDDSPEPNAALVDLRQEELMKYFKGFRLPILQAMDVPPPQTLFVQEN